MPTETYTETVTKTRDVCDFCGKQCMGIGTAQNQCDICSRLACLNCGCSEQEGLLSQERKWLCQKCHELGIVYKQSIRRWKERIVEERKGWRKLGKERAKGNP